VYKGGEGMDIREYLGMCSKLDGIINSKLEYLERLKSLIYKTSNMSDVRVSDSSKDNTERLIVKIIDLQDEINRDIDSLVDLKREIRELISKVEPFELRSILDLKYVCGLRLEDVALKLNYSIRHIMRLHAKALSEAEKQHIKRKGR